MWNLKVLIVEDERMTAETDAAKIRAYDIVVKIVTSGNEAMSTIRKWLPDLVVLDLKLPGKNGPNIAMEMMNDPMLRWISKVSNSGDMRAGDSMGQQFFNVTQRDFDNPIMIDKSKPADGMVNNLIAAIGITLWERMRRIPPKMVNYLNELNKGRKDWVEIRQPDDTGTIDLGVH